MGRSTPNGLSKTSVGMAQLHYATPAQNILWTRGADGNAKKAGDNTAQDLLPVLAISGSKQAHHERLEDDI